PRSGAAPLPLGGKRASRSSAGSRPPGRSATSRSLHAVRFEVHVGNVATEHDDGAVAAVVAGVRELERIGALYLHLPFVITREAHPGERDRVIQELQLIALAGRAPGAHRALARLQADGPEQRTDRDHQQQRKRFPHDGRKYTESLKGFAELPSLKATLLDLNNHAHIGTALGLVEVKLYGFDPPLQQRQSAGLLAPKADPTEPPKLATITTRNAANELVEIVIPSDHNGRESISYGCNYRIRRAARKKISHIAHLVATCDEELRNRVRNVFVN